MGLTKEKFLRGGHLFQDGDSFTLTGFGFVNVIGHGHINANVDISNKPSAHDDKRFVVKARCLMLPKHFRLYRTPEYQKNVGEVIVLNKDSGKYFYAHVKNLPRTIKKLGKVGWGGDFIGQKFPALKPIISFAQLGE